MIKCVPVLGVGCPPLYGNNEAYYIDESVKALKRVKAALKHGDTTEAKSELEYAKKSEEHLLTLINAGVK